MADRTTGSGGQEIIKIFNIMSTPFGVVFCLGECPAITPFSNHYIFDLKVLFYLIYYNFLEICKILRYNDGQGKLL